MTTIPTLMGAAEIGRAIGVSPQRVNGIINDKRHGFPDPVITYLSRTRLWLETDVRKWVAGSKYTWREWKRPEPRGAGPTPAPPPARPTVGLDGFCRGCQEPAAYCACGR